MKDKWNPRLWLRAWLLRPSAAEQQMLQESAAMAVAAILGDRVSTSARGQSTSQPRT